MEGNIRFMILYLSRISQICQLLQKDSLSHGTYCNSFSSTVFASHRIDLPHDYGPINSMWTYRILKTKVSVYWIHIVLVLYHFPNSCLYIFLLVLYCFSPMVLENKLKLQCCNACRITYFEVVKYNTCSLS